MSSRTYAEWMERIEKLPILRTMTSEEWEKLFANAEPPTEDDVPWRFPVRTPVKPSTRSDD